MDELTGVVRTKGDEPFAYGKEYEIGVSARDCSVINNLQRSPTHSLKIVVGERDPQFYETPQYVATVAETQLPLLQYVYVCGGWVNSVSTGDIYADFHVQTGDIPISRRHRQFT